MTVSFGKYFENIYKSIFWTDEYKQSIEPSFTYIFFYIELYINLIKNIARMYYGIENHIANDKCSTIISILPKKSTIISMRYSL